MSTTFSGAKLEALLLNCSSSSRSSSSTVTQLSVLGKPRTSLIQKGIVRCDAQSSEVLVKSDGLSSNATTLSALEQLKTSAADSKSMLICFLPWVFFYSQFQMNVKFVPIPIIELHSGLLFSILPLLMLGEKIYTLDWNELPLSVFIHCNL